jgi:3'-phosphoadenosine 5'-phosphosulfate sulfotransferase (PAPS reductase)/FAD synthetase
MAGQREYDYVLGFSSGGLDSGTAIEATRRYGPEFGIELDAVVHLNTGAGCEVTRETLREYCASHGLPYIEATNPYGDRKVGPQTLKYGFPGPGGGKPMKDRKHLTARILRKDDPEGGVYSGFGGQLLTISGAHVEESDQREANMGSAAVDFGESGTKRPRQTWCCPLYGLLPHEIDALADEWDVPESPTYDTLGYSGDCTGCSYDDWRKFHWLWEVDAPLAWAWSTLMVWMQQLRRTGRYPLGDEKPEDWQMPPERTLWGWGVLSDDEIAHIREEDPHWNGGVGDLNIEVEETADCAEGLGEYLGCESCSKQCEPAFVPTGEGLADGAGYGGTDQQGDRAEREADK